MLPVEGYPIHFENVTIFHGYVITNVACGRLYYPLYVRYQFHSYVITNVASGRLFYPR